ncbi:23309_t:CDS:2, partial [Racocetra persica]
HQTIDSIEAFDHITYSTHVITINDESKTCNIIDGMKLGNRSEVRNDVSENISVYSTISQGPSDIAITEAERLFSLLKNQKDKIDNILDSHAVYAVGPKFQNDYSMPYIACWVANPLTESIMEKISGLFNHEFGVAYHLVKANDNNGGPNNTSNASGNISGGFSTTNSDMVEREGNDENSDDNDNGGVEFEDKKIIGTEDKKMFQYFNITIKLWVNVKLNSKNNSSSSLEFEVDLNNCAVTDLLSEQCPSLDNFICYYIDSLEICASPLKSDNACIIIQKQKHSPHKSNNDITSTKVHDKDYLFQMDVGAPQSIKATFGGGTKKGRSLTAATKEWAMRDTFSGITGNKWSYRFTDSDIGDNLDSRVSINTDVHKSHWDIGNKIAGFRVTITQKMGNPIIKKLNSDFKKHAKKKCHGGPVIIVPSKSNNQPQQENNEGFISRGVK